MHKNTFFSLAALVLIFFLSGPVGISEFNFDHPVHIQSAPDRIFVRYKKASGMTVQAQLKALIESTYGLKEIGYFDFIDVYLYRTYWNKDEAIKNLNKNPNVEYAEPDFLRFAYPSYPDDSFFNDLWGLHNTGQTGGTADADIDAPEAWDLATGNASVIVGVIDTGVDYNHTDLKDNMWTNPDEIPNNGADDDGNGYIDDVYGIKAVQTAVSGDPLDNNGHGTHCSGTIAAKGFNSTGVVGVCWTAKIMALKFLNDEGTGYDSDAVKCIAYAINKGAHILSNSWGGGAFNLTLKNAIEAARDAGILFIAAAGNEGGTGFEDNDIYPEYPASYDTDSIIAVAATDHNDSLASFSNYGQNTVDVAAPGQAIKSTTPDNNYGTWSGTSMATPHVAGLAALVKSSDFSLDWQAIKNRILNGVEQKSDLTGKILTGGRINAFNSLLLPSDVHRLAVLSFPDTGVDITVTPLDFFSRGTGTTNMTRIFHHGTSVTLTAPSLFDSLSFLKWTLDGVDTSYNPNLQVTMDGNHTAVAHYLMELCEALDNCSLTWETGGAGEGWYGQTSVFYSDSDAAQSPNISDNQSGYLQTSVQGPQTLIFYWKVSSEDNYDFLRFFIDDEKLDEISGNVDWHQKSFPIESGTHTLKWVYDKDYSISTGSDCGWVDKTALQKSTAILLSKTKIHFGAGINGPKTPSETVFITNTGDQSLNWQAQTLQSWINITPTSGSGKASIAISIDHSELAAGNYNGEINIIDPNAVNSPQKIVVILKVYAQNSDSPPLGFFDTPVAGSTVSGSIAVTGWALDDIGIKKVEIKREPDPDDSPAAIGSDGLVYIGDAVFVKDSRPDVQALYPDTPQSDRSGWGYMMLTYGLPRLGNGIFTLYAIAEDLTGKRTQLGTKPITSDNANRTQPFGSIDTPGQGEVVSGNYVNFGWVLTPLPKQIPKDGSTIWVSIDGTYIGNPDYNYFRQDIYDSFPGYANSDGAVGFLWIDTTQYANGMHNIGWYAVDSEGSADGFGSRFFEIQNPGGTSAAFSGLEVLMYREDPNGRLKIRVDGPQQIEVEQLEKIEIQLLGEGGNRFVGWGRKKTKGLPVGSTLDKENGTFKWSAGPAFFGNYVLHFAVTDGFFRSRPAQVTVKIGPRKY